MRYTIQGHGDVNVTQQNFVASGGQGSIYVVGDTALKVYHDPSQIMPEGKIQELQALPTSIFSRPERMVLDDKGRKVGYTTRFVKDAYVLCQLFSRAFRERSGLSPDDMFKLVLKMREGFDIAHRANILLVDPNEMNFLVDSTFSGLTFIDTDSYQTRSYPATAIMESIRDRHMPHPRAFNEGTDWFSFAVTSFQLLLGIHPYKGKHPTLKGFDARMKANVSIFNKDVRVPSAAYPLSVLPKNWRGWYEAVLEKGERSLPPGTALAIVMQPVLKAVLHGGQQLVLENAETYRGTIRKVWSFAGQTFASTEQGLWSKGRLVCPWPDTTEVGFTPQGSAVAVRLSGDTLEMLDCNTQTTVPFGMAAQRIMSFEGRIYMQTRNKVVEVLLTEHGIPRTRVAASILPHASLLFQGGVIQNIEGSVFVSLFPQEGRTFQVRLPECDPYRIVDAKFDSCPKGGFLMVLGCTPNGHYLRFIFRFASDFQTYDHRVDADAHAGSSLNFVVLDSGLMVYLNDEDKLEITSVSIGSNGIRYVFDEVLKADMQCFKQGSTMKVVDGSCTYTMRLK